MDNSDWSKEVASIKPLKRKPHDAQVETLSQKPKKQRPIDTQIAPPPIATGHHLDSIDAGDFRDIDAASVRKLKRGKIQINATIDLHGMTRQQAHDVLDQFIFRQVKNRSKLVLVITGKRQLI